MHVIKFSHDYEKLPPNWINTKARLMGAAITETDKLPPAFIYYDTKIAGKNEYYQLPKGKVIVLLFKHEFGAVFTTIRRWTDEKWHYYQESILEQFEMKKVD